MEIDMIQNLVSKYLIELGIIHDTNTYWDNIIILLIIIALAFMADFICRKIFLEAFRRLARKNKK